MSEDEDVQRVLRSMGLADEQPAPTGDDEDVARVLRSMGLHNDQPAAPTPKSYTGLADLSGFKTPEESIADFTQADKDRINEYGPAAIAAAAGLALPVSAPAAAIGGLLLGTAARGATPLLKGKGIDAALHEANPLTHPVQAGLEVGLPFVGKAVARGLAAAPLSKLADFAESTGLDAALPKLDELASWSNASTASKSDVAMSTLQGLRSRISAAAPYLLKSNSDTAKIAGDRLMAYGELERFIQTNGEKIIGKAFKGIKPVERETVTQVLNGTLKAESVSPRIAEAARIMRDEFYDPMGRLAEKAGVLTEVKAPITTSAARQAATVADDVAGTGLHTYDSVIHMSPDDLAAAAHEAARAEANAGVEVLGSEGLKRYEALQKILETANPDSAASNVAFAEIQKIEAGLSEAQRARLFGYGEAGYNAEELGKLARTASDYADIGHFPDEDLLSTIGREILYGNAQENAHAAIKLRSALNELSSRGYDQSAIMEAVIGRAKMDRLSPDDAHLLVTSAMEKLKGSAVTAGERLGLPAPATSAAETVIEDAGPKVGDWVPFKMKGSNYSPEIPLESKPYVSTDSLRNKLFSRSKVAYQRLPEGENEVALMTDAHDIAQSYLGTMTRKIAASHAFGSPTKSGKFGEVGEQLVNQLYHEAADDPLAPRLLESSLERIYTGKKPDPLEGLAQKASSIAAKVQLGKAALRSIPQIGTNIRQHGLANTIEGLTRYATDPSMRELIEKSGAKAAALADYAGDLGVGARTIPMRMHRGIERFNRGAANAGIVPQIEKIGERIASGKKLTTAQERILAELRIKPEEFDGGVTADLVRRAAQRSADDNQLQAMAIGQVGDVIHDPLARAATQYQPFQWAQWRNFQDRVLAPLAHPIDRPAEFLMGLRRAGTGIGATAALSAPVSAIYARSGGRDPELAPMVGDAMETTAGTIGFIGSNMLQGRSPLDPLTPSVPAYSLVKEAYDNPVSIPVNAAAALDPTGAMAVLRSSLLSYLK